jgi:hypothetical protein
MSATYRVWQGLRALEAWLRPVRDDLARPHLSAPLYDLYRRMDRAGRMHSLRVRHALLASGQTHPDLLAAALLHDVGKTRFRFGLPSKVLVVLVRALAPGRFRVWGSGNAHGWRTPFEVSLQHPAWGAEMVAAAGGSPLAVELIRRHQEILPGAPESEADRLLLALQAVDDRS